ncbi:MAG: ankyrin repeat domain-containing protein [Phycisphaerae bacterium]|nr:ankyrin repeat domain-containing protein [Gemmatimonadaceae bacterium]
MSAPVSFARINLDQSRKQAKELVQAHVAGDHRALDRIRWNHPRYRGLNDEQIRNGKFLLADAQLVIARMHHFESWPKLIAHVELLETSNAALSRFESTADAIVSGDIDALRTALDAHPDLVSQRSTRSHHSTLLHYVSANGVEDYRQLTPVNILDITTLLLDRGAEVDATSAAYGGGSTTLGLASTSAHPRARGVQLALIDLLVARGAKIDGEATLPALVHGALANACPEAANHLASLGHRVPTLYGASAVGDLQGIRAWFATATTWQREDALIVAAQMGQADAVTILLDNGVNVLANNGMSPMHYAAANGHIAVMELLLARGADLEQRNEFDGTVLDSTLWFVHHVTGEEWEKRDFPRVLRWLVDAGARTDLYPELVQEIDRVFQRTPR